MSTESTNTSASSESSSSEASTSGVGTQSSNAQAEATQHGQASSQESSTESSVDTGEESSSEETASERLNINEMIVKQLQGEQFSEQDIAKLEKAGLSVDQIGMLADAHKQVQLKNNNEIYDAVGGQEVYEGLKQFAAEHLDDSEAEAINSALRSGNMRIAKMAVLGLKALADQENGVAPSKRITSTGVTASSEGAYATQQDLIKDLNNRKYGRDPEFTAQVDKRRNKSGF